MASSEGFQTRLPDHLGPAELEAGLQEIRRSPQDSGVLSLIVRRPQSGERELLDAGHLDLTHGLLGDNWKTRGSPSTPDGQAHPERQITIMNSRVIALLARRKDRWALAGDQLYIDLDLSGDNLPIGSRLAIGDAVIEIAAPPHTGCKKFEARFGTDALKFISSPEGKQRKMRGINARVVQPGLIRVGDVARKIPATA